MPVKKWIMKQYWRVGTIRSLASLGLGVLVLGKAYYVYIPALKEQGLLGALVLGSILFVIFLFIGYLYDKKARMWSQKTQVSIERNPYYYIANHHTRAMEYPIFYSLLWFLKHMEQKLQIESSTIDELVEYLNTYFGRDLTKRDLDETREAADEAQDQHYFEDEDATGEEDVPLTSRAKIEFETTILRLNWIQGLTGLVQDTLVFGAFYVTVFFPWSSGMIRLLLSIFGIAMPLLIVLIIAGWYYDRKLRIWSADKAVIVERNPYSYVAEPKIYAFFFPFFIAIFRILKQIATVRGVDTPKLDSIAKYMHEYSSLVVSEDKNLVKARELRKSIGSIFREGT